MELTSFTLTVLEDVRKLVVSTCMVDCLITADDGINVVDGIIPREK